MAHRFPDENRGWELKGSSDRFSRLGGAGERESGLNSGARMGASDLGFLPFWVFFFSLVNAGEKKPVRNSQVRGDANHLRGRRRRGPGGFSLLSNEPCPTSGAGSSGDGGWAGRQDTPPRGVSGFLRRSMKTRRGRTSPPVLTVPTTASGSRGAPPLDERSRAGEGSRQDRPVTSG